MKTQPRKGQRKSRIRVPSQPTTTEYVYHWNRIIGVLVVLVLLIGLIGFAISGWLWSPSALPRDTAFDDADVPVVGLEIATESGEQHVGKPVPGQAESSVAPALEVATPLETVPPVEAGTSEGPAAREPADDERSQVFLPPGTRVNLRAAPSLASPVLRILDADSQLRFLETAEDFYRVRSADGVVGWVSRDFSSRTPYATPVR
ncbi:protein of unknown function DUF1058 [Thioalkalivibrio nitratireducens DSM 14787]|uniref:SH3b domain-containing protein n=2 Tax=Thioalkalivibrio nitratireducens TaxID=186931 RepID=L0E3R8_THIND|nr:protein of unknown function DUF1058 [Thioalkalivibrio nitratireducens DSM 14787]